VIRVRLAGSSAGRSADGDADDREATDTES